MVSFSQVSPPKPCARVSVVCVFNLSVAQEEGDRNSHLYGLFDDAFDNSGYITSGIVWLVKVLKGAVVALAKYQSAMCLEEMGTTTRNLSQEVRCPKREWNRTRLEYHRQNYLCNGQIVHFNVNMMPCKEVKDWLFRCVNCTYTEHVLFLNIFLRKVCVCEAAGNVGRDFPCHWFIAGRSFSQQPNLCGCRGLFSAVRFLVGHLSISNPTFYLFHFLAWDSKRENCYHTKVKFAP